MEPFLRMVNQWIDIDPHTADVLVKALQPKSFRKGDFLLKADQTCRGFYFLQSGLVKLFYQSPDRHFIMTFFEENSFFTELSGFYTGKPSQYMLLALEPVEALFIDRSVIGDLCREHHPIETLFKQLTALATVSMMSRIKEMLEDDGKQRYHNFLTHHGPLMQRISLGDLADYLGMTQVSLSRIRAQK